MTKREIRLEGGAPWGFRMNGGADAGHPLRISRVNPGSKAAQEGVREGDVISVINGTPTRLLTNGESHALLRSAGPTLTLGLNQDSTGSPKRRSRDGNKRESGSGTFESKSLNDSLTQAQTKTVTDTTACTSSSQPNKQGKKSKQRKQEITDGGTINSVESNLSGDGNPVLQKEEIQITGDVQSTQKMSSSKARRLRKSKLKNKIKESTVEDFAMKVEPISSNGSKVSSSSSSSVGENGAEFAITSPENETQPDPSCRSDLAQLNSLNSSKTLVENFVQTSQCHGKNKKEKRKNKSENKLLKSTEVLGSNDSKKQCKNNKNTKKLSENSYCENNAGDTGMSTKEITTETTKLEHHSIKVLSVKKTSNETKNVPCIKDVGCIVDFPINSCNSNFKDNIEKHEELEKEITEQVNSVQDRITNVRYVKTKLEHATKDIVPVCKKEIVRIIETSDLTKKTPPPKNEDDDEKLSIIEISMTENKCNSEERKENKNSLSFIKDNEMVISNNKVDKETGKSEIATETKQSHNNNKGAKNLNSIVCEIPQRTKEVIIQNKIALNSASIEKSCDSIEISNPNTDELSLVSENVDENEVNADTDSALQDQQVIEVFVNPPTPTMGVETTFFDPDWERVEELETSSGPLSSDEDVRQEYYVHFPPNDVQAQVSSPYLVDDDGDEYGLTVQDIRNPLIPPEEEERLRCFLETLDLTKPEEFDDSSSNKSSEEAVVVAEPDCYATKQEIVVYKHCRRRCVAEPCYIPSPHRHYLDVITEENSDLSDSDRKNETERPWEDPDIIRKNNEFDSIPDDWIDSDNEMEYGYDDDGGIKSWSEGTTLDDAEGVEIIYLDSDTSDDTVVKGDEANETPQLVVVQTKEINKVLSVGARENDSLDKINVTVEIEKVPRNLCDRKSVLDIDKENDVKAVEASNQGKCSASSLKDIKSSFNDNDLDDEIRIDNNCNNGNVIGNDNNNNNSAININNNKDYETNKEHLNCLVDNDKTDLTNNLHTLDLIKSSNNCTHLNFNDEIKELSEFEMLFNALTSKNLSNKRFISENNSTNQKTEDNTSYVTEEKCPMPQEKLDVSATPVLSRQNSSSSETPTTQSTTRCTTSQSPVCSENEDNVDCKALSSHFRGLEFKNPESLKELSTKRVVSLPNGIRLLEELGIIRFKSENLDYDNKSCEDIIMSPRNISRRSSTLPESPAETRPTSRPLSLGSSSLPNDMFSPRSSSVLMFTPPSSNINSPPYSIPLENEEQWLSLQTSDDNIRVCLSPSQSKTRTLPSSPKEAAGLLDLHKKFIRRRGYHEDKQRYSNDNLPSPDLIRLEHCNETRKPHNYTPELLTEAANLLALKEYRDSRFTGNKEKQESIEKLNYTFNQTPDELSAVKRTKNNVANEGKTVLLGSETNNLKTNLSGRTAGREKEFKRKGAIFDSDDFNRETPICSEIFSDVKEEESEVEKSSERAELDRVSESSDGSRLLALIQSQMYPVAKAHRPIATTALCNPSFDRSREETGKRRTGSGDFVSGWLTMSRNVTHREGERVFNADQYRISKQGDIAVMLSPDAGRPERPKSLPPNVSSGGEMFRKKMYDEYMDKVAERYERRQQKVIKISDRPASMFSSKDEAEVALPSEVPKLEDEFMCKVKERMNKLGISSEDDDTRDKDMEESRLPKHLQEFVQLTSESPRNGVWSPVQTPEAQRKTFDFSSIQKEIEKEKEEEGKKKEEDDQTPVVWTPRSAPSPPVEKKTFRPIKFESPPPIRKNYHPINEETPKPPTSLPITPAEWSTKDKSDKTLISESIETHRRLTSSQSAESSLAVNAETSLPRAPNPTITLLQKAREGQLPRGAHYLEEEEQEEKHSNQIAEEKRLVDPNEIIYTVRRQYNQETEDKKPKKIVELGPRKFEGIGPTTREGIPIVLRSEVKDANQQKWYKRMYDSLHRAEKDREFVTVRYKTNRRGYPYSSGGGYLSEPDRLGTDYDSDAVSSKYATLDRRRIRNKENDFTTSTMPRSKYASNNAVRNAVDVYKNQPGRIEDYEPGHSSISDKEAKQWWDEVLDIFDEQFEQSQKSSKPPATTPNAGKPFMTYALKESGYESDSQLVFKRRDENLQNQLAMSPAEQKMAYKVIQKGGEVPLHGLRKPAPERPKEPISGGAIPVPERDFHSKQQRPESPHRYVESEVTIHYRSPVRSEAKEAWSEEELARRQAEAMRRIYQEERRRKYLQELQDMYSRRHTDNFIPSQKSPIPLNRYDDFLDDVSPTKQRDHTPEPKLVARALYNFVGQSSRELTFRRGDVIFVRRQIDKNWYEGEHNAMIGLFPINYVEIIPYDGIRTTPKRPSEGQARAKFNFQAQTHLELSLVKGELVVLTRRVDDNWFEGRIGSRKGIFPVSYVDVLVEPGDRAVSPVRPTTPASSKPVASPAAHSLMLNGAKNSLSHHHYTPPPPVSYTSLTRSTKTIKSDLAPVNQALHIDTQSEPVPYRALYNYKPQNDDELELNEGDTVYVMEKCDDGWYVGSSQRTGCFGTFPGNYVQRLSRGH